MRRRLTLAGVGVAGALVLTGCHGGLRDEADCPPPAGPAGPSATATAPAVATASAGAAATATASAVATPASAHFGAAVMPAAYLAKSGGRSRGSGGGGSKGSGGGGSKGSGSGSKGSRGASGGRSVHHHIDHYESADGYGARSRCHNGPTPGPSGTSTFAPWGPPSGAPSPTAPAAPVTAAAPTAPSRPAVPPAAPGKPTR